MKKLGLEKIVKGVKNAGKFLGTVYAVGVLPHEAQKKFGNPKHITTLNAVIFGLGGATTEYYFGNKAGSMVQDHIADAIEFSSNAIFYSYLGFLGVQSAYRIAKSQIKNRGVMAIGPVPLIINGLYASRKQIKKFYSSVTGKSLD